MDLFTLEIHLGLFRGFALRGDYVPDVSAFVRQLYQVYSPSGQKRFTLPKQCKTMDIPRFSSTLW